LTLNSTQWQGLAVFLAVIVVSQRLMNHSFRVLALWRTTGAEKVFVFDNPKLFSVVKTEFFAGFDVRSREKANSGKTEILMIDKHLDWDNVWFASMIDESGHVSVSPGVDAVRVTVFVVQIEKIRIILTIVRLRVRYQLTHVFANEGTVNNVKRSSDSPSSPFGFVDLNSGALPVLDDAVGARLPASAPAITFEDQRRLGVIKVFGQPPFAIVPTTQRVSSAKTRESGTIFRTTTIL